MKHMAMIMLAVIWLTWTAVPSAIAESVSAQALDSAMTVDGKTVYTQRFLISGNNYFRLRSLAGMLSGTPSQFDIVWNEAANAIEITTGKAYSASDDGNSGYYWNAEPYPATPASSRLIVDGLERNVTMFNIDGSNYFQLRELGRLIPYEVGYDNAANLVSIVPRTPDHAYRLTSADAGYTNTRSALYPRWRSTVTSYIAANPDRSFDIVEASGDAITVETYNERHERIGMRTVDMELPLFGGFLSGETYNYFAFGQLNREENDNKEVIRLVRYDKRFNRVDSVSVRGGESFTTAPFDAGSGTIAEHGDTVVFHTSRKRYTTPDGLNHQSQLTLIVDARTMTVTNDTGRFQSNHVSHSFDQYALFDGDRYVLVDHGDAYPRAVVMTAQTEGGKLQTSSLFDIPGAIGANTTGVSLGGFEQSATHYIVAMNTIDHSQVTEYTSFEMVGLELDQRDIMVSVLPKDADSDALARHITLASYIGSGKLASIPHLVKINDDKLAVLWQQFDLDHNREALKYVYIDGAGEPTGGIRSVEHAVLSETKPIVYGDTVMWHTNDRESRILYTIPIE